MKDFKVTDVNELNDLKNLLANNENIRVRYSGNNVIDMTLPEDCRQSLINSINMYYEFEDLN